MAHARRRFTDVQKAAGKHKKSPVADYVVKLIGKLYKLEAQAKEQALGEQAIYQLRQTQAIPILTKLKAYLVEVYPKTPPQGLLGKAIGYMLNQLHNPLEADHRFHFHIVTHKSCPPLTKA
jgi:transposase